HTGRGNDRRRSARALHSAESSKAKGSAGDSWSRRRVSAVRTWRGRGCGSPRHFGARLLSCASRMASKLIRPLESLSPRRANEFGGKVRGLALLSRAGFPVPEAMAISVGAAEEHFARVLDEDSRPEVLLVSGEYDAESLGRLRAQVENAPLEPAFERELEQAVAELLERGGRLAVRSSATLEDTDDYSAAGLHETILGLSTADEVGKAIRTIWGSLFEPRVLTYLR